MTLALIATLLAQSPLYVRGSDGGYLGRSLDGVQCGAGLNCRICGSRWCVDTDGGGSTLPTPPVCADGGVFLGWDGGAWVCSSPPASSGPLPPVGASFPCNTNGSVFDLWLYSPGNGGTRIDYVVHRLDSEAVATGSLTSNLPQPTVELVGEVHSKTSSGGNETVETGWCGACVWRGM